MKTECIRVEGIIKKVLPNGFYTVTLTAREVDVLAYIGGKMARQYGKPSLSDRVVLEMSPTDTSKGRIVEKKS